MITRSFVAVAALFSALLLAAPPAVAADPVYGEQARDTWTVTGGQVFAMARIGNNVAIGGTFTGLRSPAGVTVARSRIALVDANTGEPVSTWNPGADGTVRALATSSDRLYVGGAFTTIGGVARSRLAALLTGTGAVDAGFRADASAEVRTLLPHNGKLYAGGLFTAIAGKQRLRAAAVSPVSGALDTAWTPAASWAVNGLAAVPGTTSIVLGGEFATVSGQPRRYLAMAHQDTGAVLPWAPAAECSDAGNPCTIKAVAATPTLVYGAVAGPGGRLAAWNVGTGTRRWSQYGDGDVQSVALTGDTVYAGGHFAPQFGQSGGSAATRNMIAAMNATTGALLPYDPVVAGGNGIWAMLVEPDGLRIGGAFTSVNEDTTVRGYAVFPRLATPISLIDAGASWAYRDDGADLGTGWRDPEYDHSAWPTGAAQLGFGDGDEATTLASGRITYYLRHPFTVPAGVTPDALQLGVVRDDGVIIYLNGVEVWRNNLPAGTVTATTLASTAVAGTDESTWNTVTIAATALRTGANVLAVEVHNSAASSSDISLDVRLTTG